MNIVFSSDKKEYNTIKKGTEILLAEKDGFNQNIELFVKFQDRPEILINKRKNQIPASLNWSASSGVAVAYPSFYRNGKYR